MKNVSNSEQSFLLSYSWRVACWVIICWCVFLRFMDQMCQIPSSLLSFPICEWSWKIDNVCYPTFDSKASSIIKFILIWWQSYWDTKDLISTEPSHYFIPIIYDIGIYFVLFHQRGSFSDLLIYPPCHNTWEENYREYSILMVWDHTQDVNTWVFRRSHGKPLFQQSYIISQLL